MNQLLRNSYQEHEPVDATFQVVLKGVRPNVLPSDARATLATLFNATVEQIDNLLATRSYVVKKSISFDVASKYKSAINAAGGACELVPEKMPITAIKVDLPNSAPLIADARNAESSDRATPTMHAPDILSQPATPRSPQPSTYTSSFQSASDRITGKLGLEKIEGFSLRSFFSEAFRRHDPDEVERLLSVGTSETTPVPNATMGAMPNPWIFFRVLSGTVIAYMIFLYAWNRFGNLNLVPGLIVIGSFAVPFSILILFFELNTPKNISIIKIVQLVVVGGSISLLLSLFLFEFTPFLGYFGASAAGFVEEIGKLAALLFVIRTVKNDRYKYRLNALLLGAAVGTGFASFESAGYALRIGLENSDAMLENIQLRGAMSPFGHIVWTAIAASAFWIARPHHKDIWGTVKSPKFLKIFLIPVALHFVWNLPFEGPFMAKFIALGFIAWVVIISLVQSGLREISESVIPKDFKKA